MKIGIGGYAARQLLLNGYSNYAQNTKAIGFNLKVKLVREDGTTDSVSFGAAVDFLPLWLPAGTYGNSENIFDINVFMDYNFFPGSILICMEDWDLVVILIP